MIFEINVFLYYFRKQATLQIKKFNFALCINSSQVILAANSVGFFGHIALRKLRALLILKNYRLLLIIKGK